MDDLSRDTIEHRVKGKKRRPNKKVRKHLQARQKTTTSHQLSMYKYIDRYYSDTNGSGHIINTNLEGSNIRFLLKKPRGVIKYNDFSHKRDGQLYSSYLLDMQALSVDVICLPETNLNWRNQGIRKQ